MDNKYNYELGQDTATVKREMPDLNGERVFIGSHVVLHDVGFYPTGGFMDVVFKRLDGKIGQVNRIFYTEFENFSEKTVKIIFADGNSVFCHSREIVGTDLDLTPIDELKSMDIDSRKSSFVIERQDKQLGLFGVESQAANVEL